MVNRAKGWLGVLNDTCSQARQQVMGANVTVEKEIPTRRQRLFTQQHCS
jgi:hypothetical protein